MNEFPYVNKTFLLPGPVGKVEVMTTWPRKSHGYVAIVCHPHPLQEGTMHNKVVATLAKTFDKLGLATVRFNYRGVGKSEGSYGDMRGEIEDLVAVKNWVKGCLKETLFVLAGFSFGSYIAASAANQCSDVIQLITVAPAVNHADFTIFKKIRCPWLVIHGDQDEIVPHSEVAAFASKPPSPLRMATMAETGHFFHGKLACLQEEVIKFQTA